MGTVAFLQPKVLCDLTVCVALSYCGLVVLEVLGEVAFANPLPRIASELLPVKDCKREFAGGGPCVNSFALMYRHVSNSGSL
jgi:hypothetical protein